MNPTSAGRAANSSWDGAVKRKLRSAGPSVRIGRGCSFFSPDLVMLGEFVRIDASCIITGGLVCAGFNHISSNVWMNGSMGTVTLGKWSFIGAGSKLVTASDDYTGSFGPVGPFGKNRLVTGDITLGDFAGIAIGTTLLPGVTLPEGTRIAGNGWLTERHSRRLRPWVVYAAGPQGVRPLYHVDEATTRRLAEDPDFRREAF